MRKDNYYKINCMKNCIKQKDFTILYKNIGIGAFIKKI